jgi:hypothetical protein
LLLHKQVTRRTVDTKCKGTLTLVSTVTFTEGLEDELNQHGFELTELKQDLKAYFDSNKRQKPYYFGKDAPFTRPDSIWGSQVHHIHLYINGVSCDKLWMGKTSDTYLVYTFGDLDTDQYLVLDFLADNAHEQCKKHTLMTTYKVEADSFRMKF